MSQWILGELESISAFVKNETLYVVGAGTNTSSGWINDFLPDLNTANEVDLSFVQKRSCGVDLPVMTPFVCVETIEGNPYGKTIRVLYMKNGQPFVNPVPIREELSPSDLSVVASNNPVQVYFADDIRIDAALPKEAVLPKKIVFKRVLAGFTNPLDCCDLWPPRCRGMKHEWILEVVSASEHDLKGAVEGCLRNAAVAAALAALPPLLVGGGAALEAAIAAFLAVLKPCLEKKLPDLISVTVHHRHHCK